MVFLERGREIMVRSKGFARLKKKGA